MAFIIPVRGFTPKIGEDVFLAENATIIGDTVIGDGCSIWFNAVIRGDVNSIRIGKNVNIQDGSVLHTLYEKSTIEIGDNVSVGHNATIHGAKVGSVLVGKNVGLMNLDNMAGTPNPYSEQGLLDMFTRWDAQTELIETFYPMVMVRTIALKMSASIVFCLLVTYWFASKIDDQYAKLKLAKK